MIQMYILLHDPLVFLAKEKLKKTSGTNSFVWWRRDRKNSVPRYKADRLPVSHVVLPAADTVRPLTHAHEAPVVQNLEASSQCASLRTLHKAA
jgi:hypothetical protein